MPIPAGSPTGSPASGGLVSLAEAKAHLNMAAADTTHDGELQGFIDAVTPIVEDIVGPVNTKTYTEWHHANGNVVLLRHRPVVSITSVTEYAGAAVQVLTEQIPGQSGLDAFGFFVPDYDAGIIERTAYGTPSWFGVVPWVWSGQQPALYVAPRLSQLGQGRVKVVYTAGRASLPANIRMGALELIRDNYQPTQQGNRPAFGNASQPDEYNTDQGSILRGWFVHNRVREMLAPSGQTGGIA